MTRKSLSGYWASSHHRMLGTTTDKARRLAIALGAIKSVVRVVDRTPTPLSVDWAAVDEDAPVKSMSYTDLRGGSIHINPMPILDESLDHGAALDVCIGFGLHEASHSQESRDRFEYLLKREVVDRSVARRGTNEDMEYRRLISRPGTVFDRTTGRATREVPAFEPMRVALYLWNLVEDVRIEGATSKRWPGTTGYFGAVLDYMWFELRKHHDLPVEYGSEIKDRLRVAFLACRYPGRFDRHLKAGTHINPALLAEIEWWQAWQADYLSDAVDTPTTIQRGLDHLAEDETTAEEMEKLVAGEQREREFGEKLRAQIDRLLREGVEGAFEMCVTDQGEIVPLDAETAEEVRKLVREGLIEMRTVVTASGAANPPVHVRKPEETTESRRAYVGRPNAEAEALRAALVFRASAPQHDAKLLKSGSIDDDELYRWGLDDYRVFSERVVEAKPDVFMGLLVDMSGSMYGTKLTIAQRLAQLFVWAVHDQEGIQTQVWGHTADSDDEQAAEVFRLWEPGDSLTRLGLIATLDHSSNADGHAIAYVASQIALTEQPEKVLIVLSDGLPSADGYGGKPAQQHIRGVCRWALSRGVRVIQVAIDPGALRPDEQAAMFGPENWLGFSDYAALPRQIANLLRRYI